MITFKDSLPNRFIGPISKEMITMNTTKKAIRVGGKDVFDMDVIYSRVLGLQQCRDIDFTDILRHELAPLPTTLFNLRTLAICALLLESPP